MKTAPGDKCWFLHPWKNERGFDVIVGSIFEIVEVIKTSADSVTRTVTYSIKFDDGAQKFTAIRKEPDVFWSYDEAVQESLRRSEC